MWWLRAEQYKNTPLETSFRNIMAKIAEMLPNQVFVDSSFLNSDISFISDPLPEIEEDVFNSVFNLTNQLRTGSEANYVDLSGNTVNVTGLKALVLDESLSNAAKETAKEVAVSFSHTRPNGQTCWTLYAEQGATGACGENIAAGSSTGAATFRQWKEDGKPYSGQGHRRNMLSRDATRIGIAGFKVTDFGLVDVSQYPEHWGGVGSYYWVMVLGR